MNPENTDQQPKTAPVAAIAQPPAQVSGIDAELPNYREIMNRVMEQLKSRKGTLFKRVLVMLAPIMVGFIIISIAQYFAGPETDAGESTITVVQGVLLAIGGFLIIGIGWPWALIFGRIFRTERLIWIDSFFDNIELTTAESWKLAKKLFWPSVLLQLSIFFRYYAPAILVTIAVMVGATILVSQLNNDAAPWIALAGLFLPVIGLIIYAFLLQVRLRYVWFVFLDLQGTHEYSRGEVFKRAKELNAQLKQQDFKKLIATTLAADAAAGVANIGLDAATGLIGRLGGPAKTGASLVNMVGQTMVEVSKEYAKQVSYYMFYRLARQKLYGANSALSTSLYEAKSTNTL